MNSAIQRQLAELKKEVQHRQNAIDVIDALDVTQHIAPVYMPLHEDIQAQQHQYYNLPGGRGSGKSSFCALEIVNGVMHDTSGQSNAIVFRRTANTMRESVYSQIAWAIDVLDVNNLWRRGAVISVIYGLRNFQSYRAKTLHVPLCNQYSEAAAHLLFFVPLTRHRARATGQTYLYKGQTKEQ